MSKRDNQSAMSLLSDIKLLLHLLREKSSHLRFNYVNEIYWSPGNNSQTSDVVLVACTTEKKYFIKTAIWIKKKSFFSAGLCAEGYLRARTSLCMHVCVVRIIYHIWVKKTHGWRKQDSCSNVRGITDHFCFTVCVCVSHSLMQLPVVSEQIRTCNSHCNPCFSALFSQSVINAQGHLTDMFMLVWDLTRVKQVFSMSNSMFGCW